jgi:transposase-like protein
MLGNLKELLKEGYSLRDAIRKVGVGWKNLLPVRNILTSRPRSSSTQEKMKRLIDMWFPYKIDTRTCFIMLWEMSKYAAKELLVRKYRRMLYVREFNQFRKIADELMIKWSYELAQGFFNQ